MDDLLFPELAARVGFRLHKLEVYNWGAFDSTAGQVYAMCPAGQTSLLIGQNGSGKSTLVDALLTLLVRPVVRNYNVAAGAQKQERDERSYLKGAYDRRSREDDHRGDVQYLRPEGGHYSVLLACFRDEAADDAFTVAQVLYLNSASQVEKVYCFAPDERSIANDCAGLVSTERIRQEMENRGFRATMRYKDYHAWLTKATGMRPKAMDVFNQTVAVKDIHSLTEFIRQHMLEARPWGERVGSLLSHFTQLSEAHQSLVRVRRQFELLTPIARRGRAFRQKADRLAATERLVGAADVFFRQQVVDLFTPLTETLRAELTQTRERKEQLSREIAAQQEEARRLKNEIEAAGGDRLKQIPLLIETHQAQARSKREASHRLHAVLGRAGIPADVTDAAGLARIRASLPDVVARIHADTEDRQRQRDEQLVLRGPILAQLQEDQTELAGLPDRRGNLPPHLTEIRNRLCAALQLEATQLPFVAELIAVKPAERAWEASLETVLRNFALSLLIPDEAYYRVSSFIDRTQLTDRRGRGGRLVYRRVQERPRQSVGPIPHERSLLRKLDFRAGHPLLAWVQDELQRRFDYRCAETVAEFQAASGPAVTLHRHVKVHDRHEKDDRQRAVDPRNFVLGWDNREKQQRLGQEVHRLEGRLHELDESIAKLDAELAELRQQLLAGREVERFRDFDDLDYLVHEREVAALRAEQRQMEGETDAVRLLQRRLAEADSRQATLQKSREEAIKREGKLEGDIDQAEQLMAHAQRELDASAQEGTLDGHRASFGELAACFATRPLIATDLLQREHEFLKVRRGEIDLLRQEIAPLEQDLTLAMNRFLREFREEQDDLDAGAAYLDSFLGLLARIREDDLPRLEGRFKDRLNEKVIQEIGILHGALQSERAEIEVKIGVLNQSLRQLEYRPGTHMRLEARLVRDQEISDFRHAIGQCLADTFTGSLEADEARYAQIEKLVVRLREETRWRDKVTDVRRWFDFAAREIERATGHERGYYEDSTGQSGGEKAKLAFTILVAAIAYQYDIDPAHPFEQRFHFVVVDEMFSKVDDQYAEYALELFKKFGLQLLVVAPLDAKARVTEPYVGCYLHVVKDQRTSRSEIFSMTAQEFEAAVVGAVVGAEPDDTHGSFLPFDPRLSTRPR